MPLMTCLVRTHQGTFLRCATRGHPYVALTGPEGWRIVDVLADGAVSRVAVQRSDFRQLIRQGGAPALGQSLSDKFAKSVELTPPVLPREFRLAC